MVGGTWVQLHSASGKSPEPGRVYAVYIIHLFMVRSCQIGYYHLVAAIPEVVKGTDFEKVASVFQGAWPRIQRAVDTAGRYGIGVLLDLHCAAGEHF